MISGGIAVIAAMIVQPAGQALAWVAWAFLEFTIAVVQWTAQAPWAAMDVGQLQFPLLALYYAVLFGVTQIDRDDLRARLVALRSGISARPALVVGVGLIAGMWLWNDMKEVPSTAPKTHQRVGSSTWRFRMLLDRQAPTRDVCPQKTSTPGDAHSPYRSSAPAVSAAALAPGARTPRRRRPTPGRRPHPADFSRQKV